MLAAIDWHQVKVMAAGGAALGAICGAAAVGVLCRRAAAGGPADWEARLRARIAARAEAARPGTGWPVPMWFLLLAAVAATAGVLAANPALIDRLLACGRG